jgi:hypothetical protein
MVKLNIQSVMEKLSLKTKSGYGKIDKACIEGEKYDQQISK